MEKDKRKLPKNFKLPDWLSVKQKFEIYRAIIKGIPIIITGKQGKTGKTYLKDYLNSFSIPAYELYECQTVELNDFI